VKNGLTNTFVETLVVDPRTPNTLYAWTRIGWTAGLLFKTTDGGKSWSPIGSGLPNTYPSRLVSDPLSPTTLYAGTKRNGLFKSTNGGKSWSSINAGLPRTKGDDFISATHPG